MTKVAIVNLIGIMPDGVMPNNVSDSVDYVFIYYRNDGDLYLYDTVLKYEFNLFNLEQNDT